MVDDVEAGGFEGRVKGRKYEDGEEETEMVGQADWTEAGEEVDIKEWEEM